ncbi:hypothetical protein [Carnobacterium maltaromaticum]|nr:hypothetical protein [Carnobacterium maltaromaticum]
MEVQQLNTLLNLLNEFNMENSVDMDSIDSTIEAVKLAIRESEVN